MLVLVLVLVLVLGTGTGLKFDPEENVGEDVPGEAPELAGKFPDEQM